MKRLLIVFAVVLLVAAVLIVAGLALGGRAEGPSLGGSKVVTLVLDRPLLDHSVTPRLPFLDREVEHSLSVLYRALRRARADDDVEGIAVSIQRPMFGLAKAEEIRRLIASFRESGKWTECYLETAGEGSNGTLAYYLATACDRISLAPAGDVNLVGIYAPAAFARGTLDKLHIEPDFEHVGEYKSAAEFFTETEHTPAAREAISALLDDLYGRIVGDIAEARGVDEAAVRAWVDGAPYGSTSALELGLIDELEYPDQFRDRVLERSGDAELVPFSRFAGSRPTLGRPTIAVVFAQGTIVRGGGGQDAWGGDLYLGSEDLDPVLEDLAEDDSVQAVVLRVDSPGGSAMASDLILRGIDRLADEKPVVASLSDVAASGGYYIAAKAHRIVAEASTITGSIGVVGGKLATRGFQEEFLGLSHEELQRGANADYFSSLDRFSESQRERFLSMMEDTYERFLGHVSNGRDMSRDAVHAVAGGRVWSGQRAVELGLVDEIGGLDRAIEVAKEAAGIDAGDEVRLTFHPHPPTFLELLAGNDPTLRGGLREAVERALGPRLPRTLELPRELSRLNREF